MTSFLGKVKPIWLLIAGILLEKGIIKKFGSNIKVLDAQGYDYTYITNLVRLKRRLCPKRIHKLFILDEAGINVDRRKSFRQTQ